MFKANELFQMNNGFELFIFFNGSWQTCRQCCFVEFRFLQWSYAVAVIDETNLCSIV